MLGGTLAPGVTPEEGIEALRAEAANLTTATSPLPVKPLELEKVQNKYENTFVFSQYRASDRALGLCHYTWLGDTSLVNREPELYRQVPLDDLQATAATVFQPKNENILIYETEGHNS